MSVKRGTEYITKLGLENGHNAVKTIAAPAFEVENDEQIVNMALRQGALYVKQYGKKYRVMIFVLKRDNTGYIIFNDNNGFQVGGPFVANTMKEFAMENIELADYMLFAEIGKNLYTVVTVD